MLVIHTADDRSRIASRECEVEVGEEGWQAEDGANDGAIVAVGERAKGNRKNDQEIIYVAFVFHLDT